MYIKLRRMSDSCWYDLCAANNKILMASEVFYNWSNAKRAALKLAREFNLKVVYDDDYATEQ